MRRIYLFSAVILVVALGFALVLAGGMDMADKNKNVTDSGRMDASSMPMDEMQMAQQLNEHSMMMSQRFDSLRTRVGMMMNTQDCQKLRSQMIDLNSMMESMQGQMMQQQEMASNMMSMMQGKQSGHMMMHGGGSE